MGRVWTGFFYTKTRPSGQDPLTKWVFFPGAGPASVRAHGVKGLGSICGPKKKKKKFRSKHKHNHNHNHNHNHKHKQRNHKHRFQIYIFPFKITIQTQISDLWFSFFPFKNHKHKHKHKFTWLRRTEPRKKKRKKKKKMETVRDWWRRGRNGVETWKKRERRGRNCLFPFLNLSKRRGWLALLVSVLPSVGNGGPASSCLMSSWCSSCYTYGLWLCMWDHLEMKRWEAMTERAEEMRGIRGWNEERNWKFMVLTIYIWG